MDKLLNDNKEPVDIVKREIDFEDGFEVEINLKELYSDKKGKSVKFKKLHEIKHDSPFINMEKIKDTLLLEDIISLDDIDTENTSPVLDFDESEFQIDLSDFDTFLEIDSDK